MGKQNGFHWFGKNRVNKWLYRSHQVYTNANEKPKVLLQLPIIDFEDVRRKIELVLNVNDIIKILWLEKTPSQEPQDYGIIIPPLHDEEILSHEIDRMPRIVFIGWDDGISKRVLETLVLTDLKHMLFFASRWVKNDIKGIIEKKLQK